jgi:hypothetical protein
MASIDVADVLQVDPFVDGQWRSRYAEAEPFPGFVKAPSLMTAKLFAPAGATHRVMIR